MTSANRRRRRWRRAPTYRGVLPRSSISRRDWAAHFSRSGSDAGERSGSPCNETGHRASAGRTARADARPFALQDDTAAMIQIERYLLRTATTAAVSGLVVLTGVVWVTQALRQIDLITSKGQTILIFLMITGLALPSLVAIIAPVALFAGILYTLNKLNGDSELVVMAASGVSPLRLLRPMALLSALVFAVVADALYPGFALEFRGDRESDDLRSRRFHRQLRPSGRFLPARIGVRISLSRAHARWGAARGVHAGPARSRPDHDLYRRGGKNGRSGRSELSPAVQGRPVAATVGRRLGDGDF